MALSLLYTLHLGLEKHGLSALRARLGAGLDIVIVGDNDYYSHRVDVCGWLMQGKAPSLAQLQSLEPFADQHCTLSNVHKTGLGSSAAMTTSLIAGVLVHLEIVAGEGADRALPLASLGLIHNTAQLAHCAAQGKVGSGFDVSASVWGNQLYRRFDPNLIKDAMREEVGYRLLRPGQEAPAARSPIQLLPLLDAHNPLWQPAPMDANGLPTAVEGMMELTRSSRASDNVARPAPLQLPPGVRLCLADVDAGSNTRTLVGQVSEFKKTKSEWGTSCADAAAQLFRVLGAANQSLADGLLGLHVAHARDPDEYARVLTALSARSSSEVCGPLTQWDAYRQEQPSLTVDMFIDVRNSQRSVRAGMRELGTRASAPVEPIEMTRVLDATIREAPGILGGGVPGGTCRAHTAGGYDALYLLFLHPDSLRAPAERVYAPKEVCALWESWSELSVGPLLCGADNPGQSPLAPSALPDVDPALAQVTQDLLCTRAGLRQTNAAEVPGLARHTARLGAD